MRNQTKSDPLKEKSFKLAVRVVNLYKYLSEQKKEFVLSKQLLRSGTNPGAMVREARYAESANDFVHKLGVAQKETNETIYWLELLKETKYLSVDEYESMNKDSEEVLKLLTSSIRTKKKNMKLKLGLLTLLLFVGTTLLVSYTA